MQSAPSIQQNQNHANQRVMFSQAPPSTLAGILTNPPMTQTQKRQNVAPVVTNDANSRQMSERRLPNIAPKPASVLMPGPQASRTAPALSSPALPVSSSNAMYNNISRADPNPMGNLLHITNNSFQSEARSNSLCLK